MKTRTWLVLVVVLVLGLATSSAVAQDEKDPQGVKTKGLVSSLGPFSATVNTPILIRGMTLELAPGGRTGRQQYAVPTYVYVIDGVMTSFYEAGPDGIRGTQYHGAGQSFMDLGNWWHNYFNRGDKPVKLLILHIGYPGSKTVERPEGD